MPSHVLHSSPFSRFVVPSEKNHQFLNLNEKNSSCYCYVSFTWHRSLETSVFVLVLTLGDVLRAIRDIGQCLADQNDQREKNKRKPFQMHESVAYDGLVSLKTRINQIAFQVRFDLARSWHVARGYAHTDHKL